MSLLRRMRRRAVAGIAAAVVLGLALAGCSRPDAQNGDRVAAWIADQEHVLSATAEVLVGPWDRAVTVSVEVDPGISDDELTELAIAADRRAVDAGWLNPVVDFDLGNGRSFSNIGGRPTLAVFLGIRDDDRYLVASARGGAECEASFCVIMAEDDPAALLVEVKRMLALAEAGGGVQTNLSFGASDEAQDAIVVAEPLAPVDNAVALWAEIADAVPVVRGNAWSVEPVGELPPLELLELEVPDAASRAVAEGIAAGQTMVDVTISTSVPTAPEPDAPTEPEPKASTP